MFFSCRIIQPTVFCHTTDKPINISVGADIDVRFREKIVFSQFISPKLFGLPKWMSGRLDSG
ncbi:MAG: hypothetical protein CLLPBCKN_006609 [Chroococcidiopsis cubana SAG 39.79]|nr:hypothetical protein [Chroococcidiopsis cubana SAG 39.79]